jgi:hypothetical protein
MPVYRVKKLMTNMFRVGNIPRIVQDGPITQGRSSITVKNILAVVPVKLIYVFVPIFDSNILMMWRWIIHLWGAYSQTKSGNRPIKKYQMSEQTQNWLLFTIE